MATVPAIQSGLNLLHLNFKIIDSKLALPLRHRILRPGQPLETAKYPDDNFETTLHVGGFASEKIIGVATFVPEAYPQLKEFLPLRLNHWRLRGMATDSDYQKNGVGRGVVSLGLKILHEQRNCDLIWCNAREAAFLFYERLGFKYWGELFELPGIGPHKVMYKEL